MSIYAADSVRGREAVRGSRQYGMLVVVVEII
jgi:hypothetical protein